jgi:hypothetical protein
MLKNFHDFGNDLGKIVIKHLSFILKKSRISTISTIFQNFSAIISIFRHKLSSIISLIVNLIEKYWSIIDVSILIKVVEWLDVFLPQHLTPYSQRICNLLSKDLQQFSISISTKIYSVFISFGNLLSPS